MNKRPTKEDGRKFLEVVSCGLSKGLGVREPGKMCVEAAWCYALGLQHDDDPPCVHYIVRKAKILLNDSPLWSSDKARAEGLKAVGLAQMGSEHIDADVFVDSIRKNFHRVVNRAILLNEFNARGLVENVRNCMDRCDAVEYNYTKAQILVGTANEVADMSSNKDEVLRSFAALILKALQECRSEGCEWLDLLQENDGTLFSIPVGK